MGKPRLGAFRKSSTKMNVPMSAHKTETLRKKKGCKTNNGIKKLFDALRSETSSCSSLDDSVVLVENVNSSNKRKLSPVRSEESSKRRRQSLNNSLIINDEGSTTPRNRSPVNCSTPIIKKKSTHSIILEPITVSQDNNNTKAIQNLNDEINNLTKEINRDSFVTIDLTTETLDNTTLSKTQNTVIDLDTTVDNGDCTVISVSNTNLSMSGDSDVTVLNMPEKRKDGQMRKFAKGIANLDSSEKARLLDLIAKNIFTGCNISNAGKTCINGREAITRATETVEDTYIKEVIVGQASSRNSIGSNIYNPERDLKNRSGLRMVVIDGSNVAMEHGRGKVFSVKGLKICIDYFLKRGHAVKAFVPRFRCKMGKSTEPRLLDDLERRGLVVYTPSREIQGRLVTSYDDRYIVQCAAEFDGVIVSGDNYRDLHRENPRWRFVIENRLLPFTWVNDMIMFPKDPLGRMGPTLEQFLKHTNIRKDQNHK